MAKHRKHRDPIQTRFNIHSQTRRDDYSIATDLSDAVFEPQSRSVPSLSTIVDDYYTAVRSTLQDVEDRRTYHPAGRARQYASPRHLSTKIKPVKASLFSPEIKYIFSPGKYVSACVRRHMRAEVLHALGKTGKGGKFNRKPRYNESSKIRC